VSFGTRAFLAVGRQGRTDFVVGCTALDVGGGTAPPSIFLEYINDTVPPAPVSKCKAVSDKCRGAC
jgi:hypothetical protein